MGRITREQIREIERYLDQQGITFQPLRNELLDHIVSDVEYHVQAETSFDEAWRRVQSGLSRNILKHIEIETMATINNKINILNVFVILSLILLGLSTFFKIMHWPGAGQLLIGFLGITTLTLMASAWRNIMRHPETKGRLILALITLSLVMYMFFIGFKLMHLPGADFLMIVSVGMILLLFPALSVHFFLSSGKLKDHVILSLLRRNGKTLETIAVVMIGMGFLFNLSVWLLGETQFIGVIFFILTIILLGLYAYSQTWHVYVHSRSGAHMVLLVLSTIALLCLMLPVLGRYIAGQHLASFAAPVLYIGIVLYYYAKYSDSGRRQPMTAFCTLFVVYPVLRLALAMEWMSPAFLNSTEFSVVWLLLLGTLFLTYRKEPYFRVLVIFMITMHMIPTLS